jgi:hypothetical protein
MFSREEDYLPKTKLSSHQNAVRDLRKARAITTGCWLGWRSGCTCSTVVFPVLEAILWRLPRGLITVVLAI